MESERWFSFEDGGGAVAEAGLGLGEAEEPLGRESISIGEELDR